jgi:hypothetical protein
MPALVEAESPPAPPKPERQCCVCGAAGPDCDMLICYRPGGNRSAAVCAATCRRCFELPKCDRCLWLLEAGSRFCSECGLRVGSADPAKRP